MARDFTAVTQTASHLELFNAISYAMDEFLRKNTHAIDGGVSDVPAVVGMALGAWVADMPDDFVSGIRDALVRSFEKGIRDFSTGHTDRTKGR